MPRETTATQRHQNKNPALNPKCLNPLALVRNLPDRYRDLEEQSLLSWRARPCRTFTTGCWADPGNPDDLARIETSFHEWIRGNLGKMNLIRPADFAAFITDEFAPFAESYCMLFRASQSPTSRTDLHSLFFNHVNGIGNQFPLIFAAMCRGDSADLVRAKARRIADYLDLLFVRRIISGHSAHSSELDPVILDLKTGDILVGVHRSAEHQAIVLEDGRIKLASGEPFTSPSSAAASAKHTKSANGWDFWQLQTRSDRRPLKELREELIRGERTNPR